MFAWFFKKRKPIVSDQTDRSYWINIDHLFSRKNVEIAISEAESYLYLEGLRVAEKYRNKGLGKQAMADILEYAKSVNKHIVLTASDNMGADLTRLEQFYIGFGFLKGNLQTVPKRHNMFHFLPCEIKKRA